MTPEETELQTKYTEEIKVFKEQLKQVLEIENTPFFKKLLLKLKSFVVFSVFGTLNFAYPAALVISITLDSLYDILGFEWKGSYGHFEVIMNSFGYMFQTSLVW